MQKAEISMLQLLQRSALGGVASALLALLLSMVSAAMVSMEIFPESVMYPLASVIVGLAVFCGAMLSVRAAGQKRLLVALGAGAVFLLLALLLRLLCFEGGWNIAPAIAAAVSAAAAGALGARKKRRKR